MHLVHLTYSYAQKRPSKRLFRIYGEAIAREPHTQPDTAQITAGRYPRVKTIR
jgi:hypothetical protein